ncbi:MAG: NADH-quinone oxidoreductase subunit F, partial [Chloroflexi bacterium]|nr:NADH-quinone oxidoreductase subunit F [Chloroflexota bacterium]
RKLRAVRESGGDERYVVANGYDADPDSPLARTLIERRPTLVVHAAAIAAHAVGATRAWLYLHPEAHAARAAAEQVAADSDLHGVSVEIALGPGGFIGGEESAMLNVLESKRAMARQRPPFPAVQGLRAKPTLVASVETLAWLPLLLTHGADAFRAAGTQATPGTKLVSLTGAVTQGGVREVPFGTTLGELLDAAGAQSPKAIQVGGPTGGLLNMSRRSVALGYEELAAVGTHVGSGQVRAVAASTCVVAEAGRLFAYLAKESCAICVPCRVGTKRVGAILESVSSGLGRESDLGWLDELGSHMNRFSLCGFGVTAPSILKTSTREFADEYAAHIKDGRCTAGTCVPQRARRYETMAQP